MTECIQIMFPQSLSCAERMAFNVATISGLLSVVYLFHQKTDALLAGLAQWLRY